ncbi:MAG: hypothetical protein ACTS73_09940 [Arsenophonus sp. NEOnobi-MAG3]
MSVILLDLSPRSSSLEDTLLKHYQQKHQGVYERYADSLLARYPTPAHH